VSGITPSPAAEAGSPAGGSWPRALCVFAAVTLLGPAVGALLFPSPFYAPLVWLALAATGTAERIDLLGVLGAFVMGGYVFGLIPAAVAGLVMGWRTWQRGYFGYGFAAAAGLIGALAFLVLLHVNSWAQGDTSGLGDAGTLLLVYAPISIGAALVCRAVLGRLLQTQNGGFARR
jgi:hypothetical protein